MRRCASARSAATSCRRPCTSSGSASAPSRRRLAACRRSAITANTSATTASSRTTTMRLMTTTTGTLSPGDGRSAAARGARCENARVTARRIAYQGEPGANSHLVCKEHYPEAEAVACASFEDVFAAVENGDADLAMIPIDNSIAGRVADIHHFLPTSNLHIVAEHFLRIQFTLMGIAGRHARHDQDRAQPRARARPVPQGDPRARPDDRHLRRHRRRRPRDRRGPGPDPGRDRAAAGRRDLRPARSSATTSRTRTTTPPASWCSPPSRSRRRPTTARS